MMCRNTNKLAYKELPIIQTINYMNNSIKINWLDTPTLLQIFKLYNILPSKIAYLARGIRNNLYVRRQWHYYIKLKVNKEFQYKMEKVRNLLYILINKNLKDMNDFIGD